MNVLDALTSRRSCCELGDAAPGDEQLLRLVEAAAGAPDHGRLRPWRLVVHRGASRRRLSEALAAGSATPDRERAKPLRAPLLVSIVFCPVDGGKIPCWEQLASVAALVYGLSLALHAQGWGSIWRTGPRLAEPAVREFLGLAGNEQLLGWLYVGTPVAGGPPPRPVLDVSTKVSFDEHSTVR